jgi:hypothetical protein
MFISHSNHITKKYLLMGLIVLMTMQGLTSAYCGDGFVSGNETCDDNNTASGDG